MNRAGAVEGVVGVEPSVRAAVALAAVLEAAVQVADPGTLETFERFFIVQKSWTAVEEMYPERRALVEAVRGWPEERKRAALEWVGENATWITQLHALAIESFGQEFEPLEWGPSMSQFDPAIFGRRAGLGPLLRAAMEDEAIVRLASALAVPREPFTPAGVAERRAKLIDYLRIPDDLPPYAALYDTLLQPTNGVNAILPDGSILFVVGPSAHAADLSMVLFHEMAHPPVDRILRQPDVMAALEQSQCVFAAIGNDMGYGNWPSFFAEALVRSLSYRLQEIPALDTGFLIEAWVVEQLGHWETGTEASFPSFLIALLGDLAAQRCSPAQASSLSD